MPSQLLKSGFHCATLTHREPSGRAIEPADAIALQSASS